MKVHLAIFELLLVVRQTDRQTVTAELLGTFWQTFSFERFVKNAGTLHAATVPM
jgi:hypothetical protein